MDKDGCSYSAHLSPAHVPQPSSLCGTPQVSFLPLIESLDINNILKLFTALLLEKRILLLSTK